MRTLRWWNAQVRLFKADYPKTDKLIAKRNWATLRELPAGMAPPLIPAAPKDVPLQPGDLLVTLRVEADHKAPHQPVKQYPIPIPTLQPLAGAYGAPGELFLAAAREAGALLSIVLCCAAPLVRVALECRCGLRRRTTQLCVCSASTCLWLCASWWVCAHSRTWLVPQCRCGRVFGRTR